MKTLILGVLGPGFLNQVPSYITGPALKFGRILGLDKTWHSAKGWNLRAWRFCCIVRMASSCIAYRGPRKALFETPLATWTPKVCRIIALYRFWAIILPPFAGLGI